MSNTGFETSKPKSFFASAPGQTYSESQSSALYGLVLYSLVMFTFPFIVFYGIKDLIDSYYPDIDQPWNVLWPALGAVGVVNVIIVLYIFKAFREDKKEHNLKKSS